MKDSGGRLLVYEIPAGCAEGEPLDAHLPAELGLPRPPLVLPAGYVGEVVVGDQHVARVDRLPEVDDGVIPIVVVVVAELGGMPARS